MSSFLSPSPTTSLTAGRYGAFPDDPGVAVKPLAVSLATLVAGRDAAALTQAVKAACGVALPDGPQYVQGDAFAFIGVGPGKWTVSSVLAPEEALEKLESLVGAAGSVCDQSDGSVVFELSGAHGRDALVKMVNIDIDPAAFKAGSAATTRAALIGVTLWQVDDAPTYRLAVARSYATAFIRALAGASAEFGFALL